MLTKSAIIVYIFRMLREDGYSIRFAHDFAFIALQKQNAVIIEETPC